VGFIKSETEIYVEGGEGFLQTLANVTTLKVFELDQHFEAMAATYCIGEQEGISYECQLNGTVIP
jgi:hypothetical protein